MKIERNNSINRNKRQKNRYIKINNLTKFDKIKYGFGDFIRGCRFKYVKYKNFIKCNYFLLLNIFIISIIFGFLLCNYNQKVEKNNINKIDTKVCVLNKEITANLKYDFNIADINKKLSYLNRFIEQRLNQLNKEIASRNVIKRQKKIDSLRIASENKKLEKYTDKELELLASILFQEANIEPYLGQKMVVQTILNRVNSDKFPNNITDVIFEGNGSQFNGVWDDDFGFYTNENMDTVINTILYPLDNKILHFFVPECREGENYKVIYEIKGHVFTYKWKEN